MTVRDLYNWCKAFKDKSAEVYLCKDFGQLDDNGNLSDLYRLRDISTQTIFDFDGFDSDDVTEVILDFEDERAE